MAQAYRCDRCKTYFVKDEEYHQEDGELFASGTKLKLYPYNNKTCLRRDFDLCPDCQEELQTWFYDIDATRERDPNAFVISELLKELQTAQNNLIRVQKESAKMAEQLVQEGEDQ